jgi:hypothetical protein
MTDPQSLTSGPLVSTLAGWRGPAIPLSLTEADLSLLDLVLCVYPELRIVAFLGQLARSRGLRYPVESVRQLVELAGDDQIELGEHLVDAEQVAQAIPEDWLPIAHEGEFLTVVHRALVRCSVEASARRFGSLTALAPLPTPRDADADLR